MRFPDLYNLILQYHYKKLFEKKYINDLIKIYFILMIFSSVLIHINLYVKNNKFKRYLTRSRRKICKFLL